LAGALDEHVVPAPAPPARLLRLAVSPGDPAPDAFFGDEQGNRIRLSRLRGRAVVLNFWQSWSAPSLKELDRLERLKKQAGQRAPFIVAFQGDKERSRIGEVRRQQGLSLVLAHDAEQRVARLYGVRCWPTTIAVNEDGRINHIQLGLSHEHAPQPSAG